MEKRKPNRERKPLLLWTLFKPLAVAITLVIALVNPLSVQAKTTYRSTGNIIHFSNVDTLRAQNAAGTSNAFSGVGIFDLAYVTELSKSDLSYSGTTADQLYNYQFDYLYNIKFNYFYYDKVDSTNLVQGLYPSTVVAQFTPYIGDTAGQSVNCIVTDISLEPTSNTTTWRTYALTFRVRFSLIGVNPRDWDSNTIAGVLDVRPVIHCTFRNSTGGFNSLAKMTSILTAMYIDLTSVGVSGSSDLVSYNNNNRDKTQDLINQQEEFHQQEIDTSTQTGVNANELVTSLNSLSSRWEILWYPITFTTNVWGAVSGTGVNTTPSAKKAPAMTTLTGYRYDDNVGGLVPVYSRRKAPSANGASSNSWGSGSTITFPSFTLPVIGVKCWDSYSYDLAEVKEQLPVLFDALYVFISMLEVVWFVGFLADKYEEVFG